MTNHKIFLLTVLFCTFTTSVALAAKDNASNFLLGNEVILETEKELAEEVDRTSPMINTEGTVIEDKYLNIYDAANMESLSRLYWRLNILDVDDNKIIDNFLRINECPLYKKFSNDDFEWIRVRKAARNMIAETRETYNNKIKAQVLVELGDYDLERKGFPIIKKTGFQDVRRIKIGDNDNESRSVRINQRVRNFCHDYKLDGFPSTVLLIMEAPFSYDFIKVDEHNAQSFLIRRKHNPLSKTLYRQYDRPAFARLRVTIDKFGGHIEKKHAHDNETYIVFGSIDGIDVFADKKETRILSSFDFNRKSKRQRDATKNTKEVEVKKEEPVADEAVIKETAQPKAE